MSKFKNYLITGLATVILGTGIYSCGPNLSTPESAINSYIAAFEKKDSKLFLKHLPEKCAPLLNPKSIESLLKTEADDFISVKGEPIKLERSDYEWADTFVYLVSRDRQVKIGIHLKKENKKWKIVSTRINRDTSHDFFCKKID